MAQKQSTDGKGASKIAPSSAEQATTKKAAKARRAAHAAKGSRFTQNSGLLDMISHGHSRVRTSTTEERTDLKQLLANFINDFGTTVAARSKRWTPEEKALAHSYVKSLAMGDGSRPQGLSDNITGVINNAFMGSCYRMIVGNDTLPGQRQEWYQSMIAACSSKVDAEDKVLVST